MFRFIKDLVTRSEKLISQPEYQLTLKDLHLSIAPKTLQGHLVSTNSNENYKMFSLPSEEGQAKFKYQLDYQLQDVSINNTWICLYGASDEDIQRGYRLSDRANFENLDKPHDAINVLQLLRNNDIDFIIVLGDKSHDGSQVVDRIISL